MSESTHIKGVPAEEFAGDLIQQNNPLFGSVWINPERMGGTPCFFGTRIPVQHLFDYIKGGSTLDDFFDDFPDVTPEQAGVVLEHASQLFRAHAA